MIQLTHIQAMVLFALVISIAFAFLTKHTWRERLKYAAWAFLLFIVIAMAIGWLLYLFAP